MSILRDLARHLVHKHRTVGMQLGGVAETLAEIQVLLSHEVDFPREQATLLSALNRVSLRFRECACRVFYHSFPRPRLQPLRGRRGGK